MRLYGPPQPDGDSFTFYTDYVHTSQETDLWASTACYRDGFTFLYVGDIRTPQETHALIGISKACYRDRFNY
jgi:hypothetical protein